MLQGMEKGKEEGRKECWKELKPKQQKSIAKKMKEKGYPTDEIADLTGLPIPEIEKL